MSLRSFGCLLCSQIWELVKGHYSFPGKDSEYGIWTAEDDRLAQMMEVFGPFPEKLLKRGERSKEFFDEQSM